uniref:RNA-directed DNA polymerase, eukaryota n=1 Tax=Tanacetum cinerariifolium TaxID=118510 RepID=A0A6L2N815_TANCI|nr:RNA-directed DNA polymerase, eukaryota [Tanacetum cinerariifolium]
MEGYTFTWSHPSGSKMSKLDRFLVSEGIFLIFPSITAVFLDRHLSDHHPIIHCEVQADFGLIQFQFYHSWISLEGFDAMVEQTWRSFSHNDANKMIRLKKKIQDLKVRIRAWIKDKRSSVSGEKDSIKKKLSDIDRLLDGGDVSDSNLLLRSELHQRRVSRDEIRLAVWNCGENKSPGPDGYSFEFFRKYWNLVGSDLYTQSAFVAYWQNLDGSFVLNELLHWCKRKKKQVMFFKVDFAKAYDSVPWDYLLDVLEAFGFGVFKGVHLHGSTSISHLFYADDVMFIGEWSDDNLKGIINILQCFFLASGLKIIIQKSQVLGVGVPSSTGMQAASSIGCGVLHKQFRYLGVMVGECMSRHNAWASTVDKLRSRLSKWNVKTLSIGGRLTLLKAVLGASPLYNMSIFKVPKGILNSMEAIRKPPDLVDQVPRLLTPNRDY